MKTYTKHSGRIERSKGLKVLAGRRQAWGLAYRKACEHDGIKPEATFAVFSATNPFSQFVDRAAAEFFATVREYQAGGYVGLSIHQKGGAL